MSKPGNLWRAVHGKITKRPTNFGWLLDSKLAGSGMPTTPAEIDWVRKQGVRSIVTMTEEALPGPWLKDIKYLHVPTEDLSAPEIDDIDRAVEFIHQRLENGEPVMVHCAAGIGRTGTILACYLIKYHKATAREAIEKVRKERPGSIQSESQEVAVGLYYKHVRR
ncbi:MAG: dual specificity protein phosphatase family protein [Thaumarchaeota archaeon]|nr:dual specificity protein phosphatase family protein [Nitrososphaerota archaeon]